MSAGPARTLTWALALSVVLAAPAAADEILFLNGDRLTGKITDAAGGKLTIKTDTAGEVSVDMAKVKTFSTDEPIVLKSGDTVLRSKVTGSADGTIQVVPVEGGAPQVIALKDVTQINPPPPKWTGALTANALVTRGNGELRGQPQRRPPQRAGPDHAGRRVLLRPPGGPGHGRRGHHRRQLVPLREVRLFPHQAALCVRLAPGRAGPHRRPGSPPHRERGRRLPVVRDADVQLEYGGGPGLGVRGFPERGQR